MHALMRYAVGQKRTYQEKDINFVQRDVYTHKSKPARTHGIRNDFEIRANVQILLKVFELLCVLYAGAQLTVFLLLGFFKIVEPSKWTESHFFFLFILDVWFVQTWPETKMKERTYRCQLIQNVTVSGWACGHAKRARAHTRFTIAPIIRITFFLNPIQMIFSFYFRYYYWCLMCVW